MPHPGQLLRLFGVASLGLFLLAPAAQSAPRVGTTAAVNPTTTGTPPDAQPRVLMIGNDVVYEERIDTSGVGQTQILFLDQSSLTVGSGASVVLDRFVYDPGPGTGDLALSVTKGVFRFIGGRISGSSGATIKTPVATLGIRGTAVLGFLGEGLPGQIPTNRFIFASCAKECSITTANGETITFGPSANGSVFTIGPGGKIIYIGKATTFDIQSIQQILEGTGGGGAPVPPTLIAVQEALARGAPSAALPPPGDWLPTEAQQQAQGGAVQVAASERLQSQLERAKEQNGRDAVLPAVPRGGRYYSTPGNGNARSFVSAFATGTGSFEDGFSDYSLTFSDAAGQNGTFTTTVLGDTYSVPVHPGSDPTTDRFRFAATETETPFGTLEGEGFYDPVAEFGFFYGIEVEQTPGETSALFFGRPIEEALLANTTPRPFSVGTFSLLQDPNYQLAVPFLRATGGGDVANATASPLYIAARALPAASGAVSAGLQASLGIDGQGAAQQSVLSAFTGRFFTDGDGHASFGGGFVGTARLGGSALPIVSGGGGEAAPTATGQRFFGAGATDPIEYFVLQNDVTGPSGYTGHNAFEQPYNYQTNPGAPEFGTNYGFFHVADRVATSAAVGVDRTSRTLNGYAAALDETRLVRGGNDVFLTPFALGNQTDSPLDVSIVTNADTNLLEAAFGLGDKFGGSSPGAGADAVASASFTFGGLTTGDAGTSAFIDDNIFAARDSVAVAPSVNGKPASVGASGFDANGLLVSQAVVPTSNFLPSGVSFCACQYLEWGYWSYEFKAPDTTGPDLGRTDRIHAGTWVAGELADVTAFTSLTGTATYTGHAIGNVYNAGEQYVAAGSFSKTWDFGARNGSVTIGNFDGATYTGGTSSVNGRDFSGALSGAGRTGDIAGSFFQGGTDPAAEVGGRFSIGGRGSAYRASGTVAGAR